MSKAKDKALLGTADNPVKVQQVADDGFSDHDAQEDSAERTQTKIEAADEKIADGLENAERQEITVPATAKVEGIKMYGPVTMDNIVIDSVTYDVTQGVVIVPEKWIIEASNFGFSLTKPGTVPGEVRTV